MKQNIKILILFLLACFAFAWLTSCTPQERLARLHKKHPELFQKDTLHVHDTTYVERVKKDTSFYYMQSKDTVVIDKGRLQMKYFYSNDTVFLSGECKDTTIIKEIQVPVEKAVIVQGELPKWVKPVIIALGAMLAMLVFLVLIRR